MKTVWEYIDCRILTSKGDIEIIRSANTDLKITAANIVFELSKANGSQSAYVSYHVWSAYTVAVEQCAGDVYGLRTSDSFGKNS